MQQIETIKKGEGVVLIPHPEPNFHLVGYLKTVGENEETVNYKSKDYDKNIELTSKEIESNTIIVPFFKKTDEYYRVTIKIDEPSLKDICGVKVYKKDGINGESTLISDNEEIGHDNDEIFINDIDLASTENGNQYIVIVPYSDMPESVDFVEFWYENFYDTDERMIHIKRNVTDTVDELPMKDGAFIFPHKGVYELPKCNIVIHVKFGEYNAPIGIEDGKTEPKEYTEEVSLIADDGVRNDFITYYDEINKKDILTGIYRAIKVFTFEDNSKKEFSMYNIQSNKKEDGYYTILFHGTVNYKVSASNISHWKCSSDGCSYMLYKQSEAAGDDDSSIRLTIVPENNKKIFYIEILHPDGTRTFQTDTDITIQKGNFEDLEITVYSDYTEEYKKKKWVYFLFDSEYYTCSVNGTLVNPSKRYYCKVGDVLNVSLNIIPEKADRAKPFGWWRNSRAHLSDVEIPGIFITDNKRFTYTVTDDTLKGDSFIAMYLKPIYIEYDKNSSISVDSLFKRDIKSGEVSDDSTKMYFQMTTALDSEIKVNYTQPDGKQFDCWCTIEYDNNGTKYFVPCMKHDRENINEYVRITDTSTKFFIDRSWRLYPKLK